MLSSLFPCARHASAKPQPFGFQAHKPTSCPPTGTAYAKEQLLEDGTPPKRTGRKMSSTWLQQNSKFRGGKKAKLGGMLRKYHISQLHVQNPVSSPRAEWGDSLAALAGAVLAGPQDCRSPYSHKDIQPQRIRIYFKAQFGGNV